MGELSPLLIRHVVVWAGGEISPYWRHSPTRAYQRRPSMSEAGGRTGPEVRRAGELCLPTAALRRKGPTSSVDSTIESTPLAEV